MREISCERQKELREGGKESGRAGERKRGKERRRSGEERRE